MKRKILENVAHHRGETMDMFHLASWTHRPAISDRITTATELLLVGSGLRPITW